MGNENIIYNMSFTAGALLQQQSVLLGELFLERGDWQAVRTRALEGNLLQSRTQTTANRVCREVLSRLKLLTADQLAILVGGPSQDQAHILWATVCKRYRFIYDFAVEVIHEKFLSMDLQLTRTDYDAFFNQKVEWHEELARIRSSTYNKLRQIVFRMLREATLLSRRNRIVPVLLSPGVEKSFIDDPALSLAIFPAESGRTSP